MIWFDIKELERIIEKGELTDKLVFNYLLIHLIFMTISGYITVDEPRWVIMLEFAVSLIALIWGVRKTFEINQEGDNRDYFKRLISLSFVAGIRVLVFVIPILFLFNLLSEILQALGVANEVDGFQENLLLTGVFILSTGLYYYVLLKSFRRINSVPEPGKRVETA